MSEGYVFTSVCHSVTEQGGKEVVNHLPPPGTRSEHLPPPAPPWVRTSTPPSNQVRTSTPPPGPGQAIYPPPLEPGQDIYPLPSWDQVWTSTPSPPRPGQDIYPLPPRRLHAGGRYASYWNAFLLCVFITNYDEFPELYVWWTFHLIMPTTTASDISKNSYVKEEYFSEK